MDNQEIELQFFSYYHLPPDLQKISRQFAELADFIVETLPKNAERTHALRKLLEAKDCAVRTLVLKQEVTMTNETEYERYPPTEKELQEMEVNGIPEEEEEQEEDCTSHGSW